LFSEKIIEYYTKLKNPNLPAGIELMNPYKEDYKFELVKNFYNKYYSDNNPRLFIFGINPGRFGGGLTGIPFTDPVALRKFCGIENNLGDKRELSSEFIYMMIDEFGGTGKFFETCYLTALFPFALLKDKKNYNFYDDKNTFTNILPYLKESVNEQVKFGARRDKVISLGLKNAGILEMINEELKLFDKIGILEHPRFIMQYKRKHVDEYVEKYVRVLKL